MKYLYVSIFLPSFCWCLSCGDDGADTTGGGSGAGGEEGDSGGSRSTSGGSAGRGGSSPTSGGTGGGATASSLCARGCSTITAVDCPEEPPDCVGNCEEAFAVVGAAYADCVDEYTTVIECILDLPASDWECNVAGIARVKAGLCEAEEQAFTTCTAL